jgi:hypothetical protein
VSPETPRIEELEEEVVGPTDEFNEKHDVVARTGGVGKRVRTRLEALLLGGYVGPNQAAAGRRFALDYLKGCVGRGQSCLSIGIPGSGNGHPSEERHDPAANFEKARVALDGSRLPQALGIHPSQVTIAFCVEDRSFSDIGAMLGVNDTLAKVRIAVYLTTLGLHYQAIDRMSPRSTMPGTMDGVAAMFDPDLKPKAKDDQTSSS